MHWINCFGFNSAILFLTALSATISSTDLPDTRWNESSLSEPQTQNSSLSNKDSLLLRGLDKKAASLVVESSNEISELTSTPTSSSTPNLKSNLKHSTGNPTEDITSSTTEGKEPKPSKDSRPEKSSIESGSKFKLLIETSTESSDGTTEHHVLSSHSSSATSDESNASNTPSSANDLVDHNGDTSAVSVEHDASTSTTHRTVDSVTHSIVKRSVEVKTVEEVSTVNHGNDRISIDTTSPYPIEIKTDEVNGVPRTLHEQPSTINYVPSPSNDNLTVDTRSPLSLSATSTMIFPKSTTHSFEMTETAPFPTEVSSDGNSLQVDETIAASSGKSTKSKSPKISRSQRSSETRISDTTTGVSDQSDDGTTIRTDDYSEPLTTSETKPENTSDLLSSTESIENSTKVEVIEENTTTVKVENVPLEVENKRSQLESSDSATNADDVQVTTSDSVALKQEVTSEKVEKDKFQLENVSIATNESQNDTIINTESTESPISNTSSGIEKQIMGSKSLERISTDILFNVTAKPNVEYSTPKAPEKSIKLEDLMMNDAPPQPPNASESKESKNIELKFSSNSPDLNVTDAPLTLKASLVDPNGTSLPIKVQITTTAVEIISTTTSPTREAESNSTADPIAVKIKPLEYETENSTDFNDTNIVNATLRFEDKQMATEGVVDPVVLDTNSSFLFTTENNVTSTVLQTTTKASFRIRKPKIRGQSDFPEAVTRPTSIIRRPTTTPQSGPPVSVFKKNRTRSASITSSTTRGPITPYTYKGVTLRPNRIILTEVPDLSHLITTLPPSPPTTTEAEEEEEEEVDEETFPPKNVDNVSMPTASEKDDITLIKISAETRVDKGIRWRVQLNNRQSREYKKQALRMHQTLTHLFRHTPVSPLLWRIEIDGFSQDLPNSRRIDVDYFLFIIKTDQMIDVPSLARIFNQKLVNNSYGRYTFDPEFTQFEVLHEEKLNPPKEEPQQDPPIPQWAIAVIVIGAASFIFIILFAAVTVYGRHHMRRRYDNKLDEDLERSVDSMDWEKRLGVAAAYENLAADGVYDIDDSSTENSKRKYIPPNPPRNPRMRHYDSWRTVWTEAPKRARLPVTHLNNF